MIRKLNSFKKIAFPAAMMLLFAMVFAACKKTEPAHVPAAGLMAFNLAPDVNNLGIAVDNNSISNVPLPFATFTQGYRSIYAGNRTLSSFEFSTGQTLNSAPQTFKDSAYYSLFVMGTEDDYTNVFVEDHIGSLNASGKAFVRYVNAVTGESVSTVRISEDGTVLFDDNNKMGFVSDFKEVTPGSVSVVLTNPGQDDVVTRDDLQVAENGVYTILLIGTPGKEGTDEKMQVRMAHYGSVTP